MENFLDKIVQYLKDEPVQLSHVNADGRVNSIQDEEIITNKLIGKFGSSVIEVPKKREWYDIKIIDNNRIYYVNIKVSDFSNSSADNLSSKIGMGYALTGKILPKDWKNFNDGLVENMREGFDYYFIIVDKLDASDVFWTSLKKIEKLVPNGNNLPFQCNWGQNRHRSSRSEREATKYILEQYLSSWNKKIDGYPNSVKEYLENWSEEYPEYPEKVERHFNLFYKD